MAGEQFKAVFNIHSIDKTKKLHDKLDRYDKKPYLAKRKKLREDLMIGEKVLVLAERIKKKAPPGRFKSNLSRTYLILIKTRHL